MKESTVNPVPLSNLDIDMKENTVNPDPHFNPDSSEDEYVEALEEYLVPRDDVEMENHESGTFHADITPVPLSLPSSLPFEHRNSDNPLFNTRTEICPLPRHTQEPRNDDNDSTSRPENNMPATQQNTAADSPLFKVGNKRPAQEEEELHRKRNQTRTTPMHIHVRVIQFCDEFVC